MALINLKNLSFQFAGKLLFQDVNLQIHENERVCLLGRNGTGKSTLMKVIHGEMAPSGGQVDRQQGVHVAYLPQEVPEGIHGTVFDIVSDGLGRVSELLHNYHETSVKLAQEYSEVLLNKLSRLQHDLEHADAWKVHQKVESVLTRMKLDADMQFDSLSAGLKRRVLLAKGLVQEPDILLLDEPTNHLDIDSINWLEEFLLKFSGTLIFVTHDRVFLQKLATRIIEIDLYSLQNWDCDYPTYLQRKDAMLEAEAGQHEKFDKKLAEEEAWIRKGIKARRTRNEGRVRVLQRMREERRSRLQRDGAANINLQDAGRSGKMVIEAKNIAFSYNGKPVFSGFSTRILRGDKIGIIGANGTGKSTLLKTLLGDFQPTEGDIRFGTKLEVSYFDQLRGQLEEEKSVIDNVGGGSDQLEFNGKKKHIISYLQDFLFPPERVTVPVKVLSGGERNRVLLAKLFTKPSNVLVLDEPTNDLDAETLELLEAVLVDFNGTVLLVSHDRAFLNNVVSSTFVLEGDGQVREYVGGYDDYLRQRIASEPAPVKKSKSAKSKPKKEQPKKLSWKEKKELEALPREIEELEEEQSALFTKMGDADFYKKAGEEVAAAQARLKALESELAEKYARWEALEAVENQKLQENT